jgi:3',5'-cyclic AMP phosphodiesterase CpdA
MPLILHLSDLHLGNRIHDDYKNECVPLEERISRAGLLRTTLRELGNEFRRNGDRLDAVIVSGDITVANNEDGFQMLPELLNELGDNYPGNERTIITPGNHDVTWFTNPSTPDHYANFLRYIRDSGYITPLLDGIDVDARGVINNQDNHFLLSPNYDWMIIPINSSNYSGSLEPIGDIPDDLWNEIPRLLSELGLDQDMVRGELTHLRLHDVARVSNAQLSIGSKVL